MQPSIDEHTAVAGRQNKTIAVDPGGVGWIDLKIMAEKNGSDFGCTEG